MMPRVRIEERFVPMCPKNPNLDGGMYGGLAHRKNASNASFENDLRLCDTRRPHEIGGR